MAPWRRFYALRGDVDFTCASCSATHDAYGTLGRGEGVRRSVVEKGSDARRRGKCRLRRGPATSQGGATEATKQMAPYPRPSATGTSESRRCTRGAPGPSIHAWVDT